MRRAAGLATILLLGPALAAPALANKADNSVRVAVQQVLQNADPYYNVSSLASVVADNVWDTLIYRNPDTGQFEGDLATAWQWVGDRTLELELRHGVKFHNGADFDADDVVYTLNFVANPQNKAATTAIRWIDHVEKVGKYRVRIVSKQVNPAAIAYLASNKIVIHPHEYYARVGPKGMNAHPVGTGPFRVAEHALGKYIRLERNAGYFTRGPKQQPNIDKVEIRYIPDPQTRVAEIVAGGVDLIREVARDQAEQLRDARGLNLVTTETIQYSILRLNTLPATPVPALRDLRVRQAIAHAIDRETMAKFLVGPDARVVHTECHPGEFGCADEGAPRYLYDPGKARQLLAEAGYPAGFDIDVYGYRDRTETEAILGYLRAVGIRPHLRFLEQATLTAARRSGKVGIINTNWSSAIYDASGSVSLFHDFSSDDMNRDPEISSLLRRADTAMDPDVRKENYARALRLIAERAYVVPLYTLSAYYVAAKDLAFKANPDLGQLKFYEMSWK